MCRYAYVVEQSVQLPNDSRDLCCEVACVHVGHSDTIPMTVSFYLSVAFNLQV